MYVQNIINLARQGKIPDGTVIDMDYDGSKDKEPYYVVYYNGRFYKRSQKGSIGLNNYNGVIITNNNYAEVFGLNG